MKILLIFEIIHILIQIFRRITTFLKLIRPPILALSLLFQSTCETENIIGMQGDKKCYTQPKHQSKQFAFFTIYMLETCKIPLTIKQQIFYHLYKCLTFHLKYVKCLISEILCSVKFHFFHFYHCVTLNFIGYAFVLVLYVVRQTDLNV